jgi:DHA2 family multidrug resistance protein
VLRRIDSRLPLAIGFFITAIACVMNTYLSSDWACNDFIYSQMVMALGQGIAFTSLIANIIMQVFYTDALGKGQWILTFSAYMHTCRIFGGECGASLIQHVLTVQERVHSNLIGLHADAGGWLMQQRLGLLASGVSGRMNGMDGANAGAVGLLSMQLRRQAYTLAFIDGFNVIVLGVLICLLLVLALKRTPITYGDLEDVPGAPGVPR